MQQKNLVRDMAHGDIRHFSNRGDNRLHVLLIAGADGDVTRHAFGIRVHDIHRAEIAARAANGLGETGEHADVVGIGQPHDEAVADRRSGQGLVAHGRQRRVGMMRTSRPPGLPPPESGKEPGSVIKPQTFIFTVNITLARAMGQPEFGKVRAEKTRPGNSNGL